jgi:hypothetical protein
LTRRISRRKIEASQSPWKGETVRRLVVSLSIAGVIVAGLVLASSGHAHEDDYLNGPTELETLAARPYLAEDAILGTCRTVWAGRRKKSLAGAVVWRYRQTIYWCWKSNKITYLSRTRWGKTYYFCWDFKGHIGNASSWNARWSYRAFTQGKFKWECAPFDVSVYPWVKMTVYGNGTWTYATG